MEDIVRFKINRRGYLKQYEPVFLKPITEGRNAVPVGNGDLAAVAWQPGHLAWMLNKSDIGGAASQVARLVIETPDKIAGRIGRLETRLSLAEAAAAITYTGGLLPKEADSIWRGKSGPRPKVTDKDLGSVQARFYVPNGRNAFLLNYKEEAKIPHPVAFVFERWIQKEYGNKVSASVHGNTLAITYTIDGPEHTVQYNRNQSEIAEFQRVNRQDDRYAFSYAAVLAFDGFSGATLNQVSPLRTTLAIPAMAVISGRIAIAVVTNLEASDPLEAATRLATETLQTPATELWEQHLGYWNSFWGRLFVDAGQPYLNALYHMAIYELGITSRGKRPVKFNGALNLWNETARTWGAKYWCHNQSESYLACYPANQPELADNFHDWIAKVRPETIRAAQKSFQVEGAYYQECMSYNYKVFEPEKPDNPSGMAYIHSSGTRYALMMWNRYVYTLDRAFLAEKAYPVIRDCAMFYVNYAKLGTDGCHHCSPSLSWEERPVGRDAHADCAAMRAIFPLAMEAAAILKVDKDKIAFWKGRLARAPQYPVADDLFSVVLRENGTAEPTDHYQWQMPNLSGVFPYSVIGIDSPAELRKLAEDTFVRYRFNADAGHEFLPVIAARLGNAEWWRAAMYQYVQFFQVFDQGLLNYYNIYGSKEIGESPGHHPYLEASGILGTAVNEMLLQSYNGKIRVFPATPERWQSRFILRAAGSYLVASEHRGRAGIPYVVIQPIGGEPRTCSVVIPWPQGADLVEGEQRQSPVIEQGVASFPVKPSVVYVLLPRGSRIEDVPMVQMDFLQNYSPAHLGNVWYGSSDGANSHSSVFPLW